MKTLQNDRGDYYDFIAVDELVTMPKSTFECMVTIEMSLTPEQLESVRPVPGVEVKVVKHFATTPQGPGHNWVKPYYKKNA